jgi:hypothetical protein
MSIHIEEFPEEPCGPANKELESVMNMRVVQSSNAWQMRQAARDLDAEGAPEKFRGALSMSLNFDQFCGNPKVYTQKEWANLIFRANDEGPPTRKLHHLYNELQRLQLCLGELSVDQVMKQTNLYRSKKHFDTFMEDFPPFVQKIAQTRKNSHMWQADNGDFLYPKSSHDREVHPTQSNTTCFLDSLQHNDHNSTNQEKINMDNRDQFPSLPTTRPRTKLVRKTKVAQNTSTPWGSPNKKVQSPDNATWNPYVTVKYAKKKKK